MLIVSVICMFCALGFYSYAVFNGRKCGLSFRHLLAFGTGLAFDFIGTYLMTILIKEYGAPPSIHNISGHYSLLGMAFHFVLALAASLFRRLDWVNKIFHRVSLFIYSLWLIAFITGASFSMFRVLW